MVAGDYGKLVPFWKENYFVKEMDELSIMTRFLAMNPDLSLVAEENGTIVGSVLGSFDGRRGYIQKLVVGKKFRRKGLGSQLIEEVTRRLHDVGALYIPLMVESDLVGFYEKSGFTKTNQIAMSN
jgi:ribosomal protein S18 acetylase RimI-like enzyme